jgi:23S rRNA pseudouridine1911/1915/1917 synthase
MESNEVGVLFEDTDVLVVHKPAGIAVHEDGRSDEPVLTDWVRREYPALVGVGEVMRLQNGTTIDRPGVVHRLDKETSGVLILAKHQEAFAHLKAQFQNREIEKEYRAFVWGEVKDRTGTVDKPIGRSQKDFRLWTTHVPKGKKVREAITRFTRLVAGNGFSYLSLEPKTGRTHQIRVHMKAIGHAIVCDSRYAPKKESALGFTRLALHAYALTLTHPNGTRMTFEAPLPESFRTAEKIVRE